MRVQILDHGYLEVIESWGSEERIIEAARMSTGKGFLGWGEVSICANCKGTAREPGFGPNHNCRTCGGDFSPHGRGQHVNTPGDEKLLRYLYENAHHTPFEMAGMIIEVQAPIFVFREWHRHRTQSYNEMSARYTPLPDVNYIPSVERLMMNGGSNKQAQGTGATLTEEEAQLFRVRLESSYGHAEISYQTALRVGVPKELARLMLPVGRYSRMRASANLRNWLAFLTLRDHSAAQWEIRQYAHALHGELAQIFPRTMALFGEGKKQ